MRKPLWSSQYDALLEMLRSARKRANLTQVEVAQRLERPQSFVAKYERGERRLDVIEFLEVTEVLQADPVGIIRKLRKMSTGDA